MIDDDLIAPAALTLTATSSNLALVRNEGLVLGGSARDRTLTIAPLPEAFGTATITVSVSDGVHTTPHVFTLTIKRDEPPTVTGIGNRTTWRDTVLGPLAFAVFDDRLMLPQMTISAISSNQAVVRDQDIVVGGLDGMSGRQGCHG